MESKSNKAAEAMRHSPPPTSPNDLLSMTTKIAHTPGPWRIESSAYLTDQGHFQISGANDKLVCEPHVLYDGSGRREQYPDGVILTKDEARANARLIAAAPELLEALKEMNAATLAGGPYDIDKASVRIRAAIAKVEGK